MAAHINPLACECVEAPSLLFEGGKHGWDLLDRPSEASEHCLHLATAHLPHGANPDHFPRSITGVGTHPELQSRSVGLRAFVQELGELRPCAQTDE